MTTAARRMPPAIPRMVFNMRDVPFVGLTPDHFPFTVEFYNRAGAVLWRAEVAGPGAVQVPGQEFFREPVGVRMLWPWGLVTDTPPDTGYGVAFYQRGDS